MFRCHLRRRAASPTLRMLAVAAFVTLSLIAAPGPASAHSELIATSPTEDAQLHKAPEQVRLTFGEDALQQGSDIVVTGPGGTLYSDASTLQIDGTIASIQLNDDQESGEYTVAYRIVSADGHVVEGSYAYSLKLPAATASPDESTAATNPDTSPAASEETGGDGAGWVLGLTAIGLVLAAAVTAVVVRRRRG